MPHWRYLGHALQPAPLFLRKCPGPLIRLIPKSGQNLFYVAIPAKILFSLGRQHIVCCQNVVFFSERCVSINSSTSKSLNVYLDANQVGLRHHLLAAWRAEEG